MPSRLPPNNVGGRPRPSPSNRGFSACVPTVLPIAVVGLAGRFPGEAIDAKALWDMCCEQRSGWSEIPESRFSALTYHHPNPSKSGAFNSRGAHFLNEDVGVFDAQFFGISPVEAKAMDPQQRLLLETTYEALENAGITLEAIAGHNTGVYVGASQIDYTSLLHKDTQDIPVYQSTGTSANILSNRISYVFNLKGPSWTMDTACSSSLAALHTACQSIRLGEITQAIVGGAHIMLSPDTMVGMSMLRLFGDDGRSYTYDSRATGYGRGEGVVSLILKPLQDAIRDGDNVRAIIRNTGANQDGKTNGITFPSCDAQAKLIESVYEAAGLDPLETDYAEAHGTGTAAGDPVEAEALARSLTQKRVPEKPLIVGSVKSNIGHLEAASGLAAMVKTIMALEHDLIPPNFDFEEANQAIPLEKWKLKVPTTCQPWPNPQIQRASISNFGFGGTNVHVICEKYVEDYWSLDSQQGLCLYMGGAASLGNGHASHDTVYTNGTTTPKLSHLNGTPEINRDHPQSSMTANSRPPRQRIFVLSAYDKGSLQERARQLSDYLRKHDEDIDLDRLAYTLSDCRSQLQWRRATSAITGLELSDKLCSEGSEHTLASSIPKIAFVFTGQGAQWATMSTGLLIYPVFAQTLYDADAILRGLGATFSLIDELIKDTESSTINRPLHSQTATTAVQLALVNLVRTWGIFPTAVVGHSSGEIAAAYAAGALSMADCMSVAYHRGRLAETLKDRRCDRPGAMLAIGASPKEVVPMLKELGSADVVLACVNAPSLVTVSGDDWAISRLQSTAEEKSLLNRRLKVDVAYHSPHMKDIADDYLAALKDINPQPPTEVEFHSSVRGTLLDTSALTAEYWVENMTSPVQFVDGVQSLCAHGHGPDVLLEIGPHSALEAPIRDILKANPSWSSATRYLPTLVRNQGATDTICSTAAALYDMGVNLRLPAVNQVDPTAPLTPLHDLPAYQWNHSKRYWHESRLSVNHRRKPFARHDLLGSLVDDYNSYEPRWRNILRTTELPWLLDHQVQGSAVFPLTGYLTMALEAMRQYSALWDTPVTSSTRCKLREIKVSRSMVLSQEKPTEISFVMRPREEGSRNVSRAWQVFRVYSWTPDNTWVEHCQGLVSLQKDKAELNPINGLHLTDLDRQSYKAAISAHQKLCQVTFAPQDIYQRFIRGGLQFGSGFQNIVEAQVAYGHAIGTVTIPDSAKAMPEEFESMSCIHPETFDACFQVTALAAGEGFLSGSDIHVPTFVGEVSVKVEACNVPGQQLLVYAQQQQLYGDDDSDIHSSFFAVNPQDPSDILVDVQGFVASKLPNQEASDVMIGDRGLCYRLHWEPCADLLTPQQFEGALCADFNDIHPTKQVERLEKAAFYYILRLLDDLTQQEVEGAPEHLQQLHSVFTRFASQSQQDGLHFQTPGWLHSTEDERTKFLAEQAASDDCGRLLARMGENLVPIFLEEVEPLSVMLRDNLMEKYHHTHDLSLRGYESGASVVSHLAHQNPDMRILEVGAGTGGATMPTLRALGSDFARYDFTDVSPSFFDSAQEEQKQWSDRMGYLRFDMEEDPATQGFDLESYDLVIAANVFHATSNIERTMKNVRKLLRPGGKVLIGELTTHLLSTTLISGCLPGWWLSEEPERREGPLVAEADWDRVLRQSGFSGIDGSVRVNPDGPNVGSVMLATAVAQQKPTYPEASILVCSDVHQHLTQAIGAKLSAVTKQSSVSSSGLLEAELDDGYGIVVALDEPFWPDLDEAGLEKMQRLFTSARGILWVSRGARAANPAASMSTGIARSVRPENAGIRFLTLDLDGQQHLPATEIVDLVVKVFQIGFGSDEHPRLFREDEFVETNGMLYVPRVLTDHGKDAYIVRQTGAPVPVPQEFHQAGRPLKLKVGQIGLLDSIHFEDDGTLASPIDANDVEIEVAAAGMNFKDLMISLGQLPFYHELGIECSGTVTAVGADVHDFDVGDRVCGLAKGCYANFVRVHYQRIAKIPSEMTFTHAASIPLVFTTVHYALSELGRIRKGESILIHAAAGGVGQAAVMLSQKAGAEVFVTVGSVEKKEALMQTYGIPEDHIYSSRDDSFRQAIMSMTGHRGVDVVLNSTSGEMLHHSWQCIAPLGRFIELGKRDLVQNSNLEMGKFADTATFAAFELSALSDHQPHVLRRVLEEVVEMHSQQILQPIQPTTVVPISDLQQAMRTMQAGKHVGKIVIDTAGASTVQALPAPSPKAVTNDAASYLITGGTGGLGRSITRWLAREGAKNIILASRSGMNQVGVMELVEELRALDVRVHVEQCDVAVQSQVQKLVLDCRETMPPIRGVIHGAMALRDALFEKMSYTDWCLNTKPRVNGAWNLHNALLDADLDFFVMLASGSGFAGNAGQAAYAASNTFLDSFAAYRNELGLPASSIDIGIVADVGYAAENKHREAEVGIAAHDRVSEAELLALVRAAMTNPLGARSFQHTLTGCKLLPGIVLPRWGTEPKFVHVLHATQTPSGANEQKKGAGVVVRQLLKQADTVEATVNAIREALCRKLSGLLMIAEEDIDAKKPIVAYGLDSLAAVELRNWITGELEATVPIMELMNSPSIEDLAGKIARKSRIVDRKLFADGEEAQGE